MNTEAVEQQSDVNRKLVLSIFTKEDLEDELSRRIFRREHEQELKLRQENNEFLKTHKSVLSATYKTLQFLEQRKERNMVENPLDNNEPGIDTPARNTPTIGEFNNFFILNPLSKVDPSKTIFPIANCFTKIRLCNSNGEWLFEYDTNSENLYFWYSSTVHDMIEKQFSLKYNEVQPFIKNFVDEIFHHDKFDVYEHS